MRDHVEQARDRGVHLGFFSSNTCYWQIRLEPSRFTGAPREPWWPIKKMRRGMIHCSSIASPGMTTLSPQSGAIRR